MPATRTAHHGLALHDTFAMLGSMAPHRWLILTLFAGLAPSALAQTTDLERARALYDTCRAQLDEPGQACEAAATCERGLIIKNIAPLAELAEKAREACATEKAKAQKTRKKKPPCEAGKSRIDGVCCWSGQEAVDGACYGVPTACPTEMEPSGTECVPRPCSGGKVLAQDELHCCWPAQAWSAKRSSCVGQPDCPRGFTLNDTKDSCTVTGDPLLDAECSTGSAEACLALAQVYSATEPERAFTYFDRACTSGHAPSCAEVARLLESRCEQSDTEACARLGIAFTYGTGVEADDARATALFSVACEQKHPMACGMLAYNLQKGQGIAPDPERAFELYTLSCELGHPHSCVNLGVHFESLDKPDLAQAELHYTQACDGGLPRACSLLAHMIRDTDPTRSYELHTRACQADLPESCRTLGLALLQAESFEAAYQGLGYACRLGDMASCTDVGLMFIRGQHPDYGVKEGLDILVETCKGNDARACFHLGLALRDGNGAEADLAHASAYIKRACELGHRKACDVE